MEPKPKGLFKEFPAQISLNIFDSDFDFAISKILERTTVPAVEIITAFFELAVMEDEVMRSKGYSILKRPKGPSRAFSFLDDEYTPAYPFTRKMPNEPTTFWNLQLKGSAIFQSDRVCQRHELAMDDFVLRAIGHGVDYAQRYEQGEELRPIQPNGEYFVVPPYNDSRFFPDGKVPRE